MEGGRRTTDHEFMHLLGLLPPTLHVAVQVGRLQGNPFREAINAIGERIGPTLAIQWVPNQGWLAGAPVETLVQASEAFEPFYEHPTPERSVLLRVPATKAVNFYQASRAATYLGLSPAPPLHPGAQIILDAACPEGLGNGSGEQAFAEALGSVPPPWGQLLGGHAPDKGGVQRALMLARMADKYPIIVAGCDNPGPLISVGVDATSKPAQQIAGPDTLVVESPFLRLPQLAYAGHPSQQCL